MDSALDTFIAEAQELAQALESGLLSIGDGGCTPDLLNDIFRSAHTIKGSAGLFGFDEIVEFTHHLENVLDRARDQEIAVDAKLLPLLLQCCDHISTLIALIVNDQPVSAEVHAKGADLVRQLSPWLLTTEIVDENHHRHEHYTTESSADGVWHISLKMSTEALKNGMDPISIIRYLATSLLWAKWNTQLYWMTAYHLIIFRQRIFIFALKLVCVPISRKQKSTMPLCSYARILKSEFCHQTVPLINI